MHTKFARWVFAGAGIYGTLLIVPMYFLEKRVAIGDPPPITHPEYYYGFIGVTLAWQIVFLLIARQPRRYRAIMLAAIVEKAGYGLAAVTLYTQRHLSAAMLGFGLIDLVLGALFIAAFVSTPPLIQETNA